MSWAQINQEVTYVAYLNIHIATLRNANLNNKYNNLHLALLVAHAPTTHYGK